MRGLRGNARGQRDLRSVFLRIAHWPCAVQFSTCDVRERSIPERVQESKREKHGAQIRLSPFAPPFRSPPVRPVRQNLEWQKTNTAARFGVYYPSHCSTVMSTPKALNFGKAARSSPPCHSTVRRNVSRLLAFGVVLAAASALFGADTAGCMLHVKGFSRQKLTQLTWTAQISEYDTAPAGGNPFKVRIEFNCVGFMGKSGNMYVGTMIQNVGHQFADDAFGAATTFPALGLNLSSLQSTFSDSKHGVQLNVLPSKYPQFGRIFEDVDHLGYSAKNIYSRQTVGVPTIAKPIIVQWTVTKGSTAVNPAGNYSKTLGGSWVALLGKFVRWKFAIQINGTSYDVADYYLPIEYAEYILATDPLVLHQEYFGSATQILRAQKGTVRYTGLQASDGNQWYPLNSWSLTWRIDDGAGNLDSHFGWQSDEKSLTSSVGHDNDSANSSRDVGHAFVLKQIVPKAFH